MPNRDDYISGSLRHKIAERANFRYEYCLINEADTYLSCEVDHIVSLKHGGLTKTGNLAYACFPCNRYKGSDIATFSEKGDLVKLFNPRIELWTSHFKIVEGKIIGLTDIGKATAKLLRFNDESRIEERTELQNIGRFPTEK